MRDDLDRRTFTLGALATVVAGCGNPTIPEDTDDAVVPDDPTPPGDTAGDTASTDTAPPVDTGPTEPVDTAPPEPSLCLTDGATAQVAIDPTHRLFVPVEDIVAGVQKTYDIRGSSLHNHRVTLTPDHFARLAAGEMVEVYSTIDLFHDHLVLLLCV